MLGEGRQSYDDDDDDEGERTPLIIFRGSDLRGACGAQIFNS